MIILTLYEVAKELQLADEKIWGLTTLNDVKLNKKFIYRAKTPIRADLALEYNYNEQKIKEWFKGCSNPKKQQVTLTQLLNNPQTPQNAINIHADVKKSKVLLFDFEKNYDTTWNRFFANLPFKYLEYSKNGGKHAIVPISDELLNKKEYQELFKEKAIYKFATTSTKHSGVELILNNHFLTFTQNEINLTPNANNEQGIVELLDRLVKNIKIKKIKQKLDTEKLKANKPKDIESLAKYAFSPKQQQEIKQQIYSLYINIGDTSLVEEQALKFMYEQYKNNLDHGFYYFKEIKATVQPLHKLSQNETIFWLLVNLAEKNLKPRDKWYHHKIKNMIYLHYWVKRCLEKY